VAISPKAEKEWEGTILRIKEELIPSISGGIAAVIQGVSTCARYIFATTV